MEGFFLEELSKELFLLQGHVFLLKRQFYGLERQSSG